MSKFGERLRSERNRKSVTLEKLANDLNTTTSTLCRYENSSREPKLDFVIELANYFDCTTDYLLGRADTRVGILVQDKVDEDDVEIEVDKNFYPNGLTHDEVVDILIKFEEMGFKLPRKKK